MEKHWLRKTAALLPAVLYIVFAAVCLLWGGRLVKEAADDRKEYQILNDEYSQIVTVAGEEELFQPFAWQKGRPLYGVRLNVATFGSVCHGTATVTLLNGAGEPVTAGSCDMTALLDNTFYGFVFDRAYTPAADETLTVCFRYAPHSPEDRLGLWAGENARFEPSVGGDAQGLVLAMQAMTNYTGRLVSRAWYAVASAILALLGISLWLLKRGAPLHRVFVPAAIALGVGFALALPPLCGPDEYSHVATAYGLAYPAGAYGDTLFMRQCDAPLMTDETGPADAFVYADVIRSFRLGGQSASMNAPATVSPYGSTARYLYWPAVLGIKAAVCCGVGFYGLLLAARLTALTFYIAFCVLALRLMPVGKPALFCAALLPSCLGVAGSVSADTMVIGLAFLYTALCLHLALGSQTVNMRQIAMLAVLALALAPAKAVYAPMVLLVLAIGKARFAGEAACARARALVLGAAALGWLAVNLGYIRYILRDVNEWAVLGAAVALLAVLIAAPRLLKAVKALSKAQKRVALAAAIAVVVLAAVALALTLRVNGVLTPEQLIEGMQPNGDSIYTYSVGYSLRHIPSVVKLVFATITQRGAYLLQQVLGVLPGEPIVHNLQLNGILPFWLLGALLFAALAPEHNEKAIGTQLFGGMAAVVLCVCALVIAACLTWTPVNYSLLFGLQGRYLLPLLPILLLLAGKLVPLTAKGDGRGACAALMLASFVALADTLVLFAQL